MKLRISGWGDYLGLPRGALNEITSILKRETEGEGNMTTKAETGKMQPKNTNSHQYLEEVRKNYSLEHPEGSKPC